MHITLDIPPDNHRAAMHAVLHVRRRRIYRASRVMAAVSLTMSAVLFGLAAVLETLSPFLFALLALLLGMFYLQTPRRVRTAVERRMAALPEHPRTVTITEAGLSSVSPLASGSFVWAYVTSAIETEEAFVLRRYQSILSVLPKSAFGSGEADELRALLAGHSLLPA